MMQHTISQSKCFRFGFIVTSVMLVSACSIINPKVEVVQPTTALPKEEPVVPQNNGAIYQANGSFRPLFEDQRARYVGDVITVQISEKIAATQSSNAKSQRASSMASPLPTFSSKLIEPMIRGLTNIDLDAKASNSIDAKGENNSSNTFSGVITCTVVKVLSNGNLVISGEKQIGLNHQAETIKFSGVIDPKRLQSGNSISSTLVADARLDYRGNGHVSEAQRMGWLQRFFQTFMPW